MANLRTRKDIPRATPTRGRARSGDDQYDMVMQDLEEGAAAPGWWEKPKPAPAKPQGSGDAAHDIVMADLEEVPKEEKKRTATSQANLNTWRAEQERHQGLQSGNGITGLTTFETKALTDDEYNALGDRQRSAVDWNSALSDAVAADKEVAKPAVGSVEREEYDRLAMQIFGETTNAYAPNTIALLKELGVADTAGNLDDYLNLKTIITDEELGTLDQSASWVPQMPNSARNTRQDSARKLTERTQLIMDALARHPDFNLDESFNMNIKNLTNDRVESLGGFQGVPSGDLSERLGVDGHGGDTVGNTKEADFDALRNAIGDDGWRAGKTFDTFMASMQEKGYDPAEYYAFAGTTEEEMRKLLGGGE
jgi:hypothetical protein